MSQLQAEVQELAAPDFEKLVEKLRTLFERPQNMGALRLVLLGCAKARTGDKIAFGGVNKDFLAFLETLKFASVSTNENTLKRIALGLRDQRNPNLHAYVGLFCAVALSKNDDLRDRTIIREALAASDFPTDIAALVEGKNIAAPLTAPEPPKAVTGFTKVVRDAAEATSTMLQIRAQDQKTVASAMFNQTGDVDFNSWKDRSFYAIYRYATTAGRIIKTFLVVNSPGMAEGGPDLFNFIHMYRASKIHGNGTRLSRGVVTVLSNSLYFVGAGVRQRGLSFDRPDGLKIISAPATEWDYDPTKIAAVYLSSNSKNGTIVGRAAFVHIGFESVIGNLTDQQIVPQPIEDEAGLLADLKNITLIKGGTHADSTPEELAAFIYERITNLPICDLDDPQAMGRRALVRENRRIPSDLL
jgi:hypothetical protein